MDSSHSRGSAGLQNPIRYFPLEKGIYEVAPGLRPWGADLGNGESDRLVFQLDSGFAAAIANKAACRRERLSKYCVTDPAWTPELEAGVTRFVRERLAHEHPGYFSLSREPAGRQTLACGLTGDRLRFDPDGRYQGQEFVSGWDALASQVQEDLAVVVRGRGAVQDRLVALHLCSPSHWAAEEKIGNDFRAVHAPIPGVEKMNRAAPQIVQAMIEKGPYVRFVWGFATDERLNHHPEAPDGMDPDLWRGRSFSLERPENPFSLRVERQVIWGLPELDAFLFVIRVSFLPGHQIRARADWRQKLRDALVSMSPESRIYKGLDGSFDAVVAWLDDGAKV